MLAAAVILLFVATIAAGVFEALRSPAVRTQIPVAPPVSHEAPVRRSQIRLGTAEIEVLEFDKYDLIKTTDQVVSTSPRA